jgi:hypothetical protein
MKKKMWNEFKNNGMLWIVNRYLAGFGWILVEQDGDVIPMKLDVLKDSSGESKKAHHQTSYSEGT